MPFTEDFTVFFEDFGVTATPNVGSPATVIFDRAHIETFGGDVSGTRPVALAVSSDVAAWTPNSTTLVISGTTYTLRDKQPDGTGMSVLELELA